MAFSSLDGQQRPLGQYRCASTIVESVEGAVGRSARTVAATITAKAAEIMIFISVSIVGVRTV
jgi:hypothetical protein